MNDTTASPKSMPMFDGRAATYASFRAKFLSWAVVQIAGVDELDALRNPKDPSTWYPRYLHVTNPGTGELTVSDDDDNRWATLTTKESVDLDIRLIQRRRLTVSIFLIHRTCFFY